MFGTKNIPRYVVAGYTGIIIFLTATKIAIDGINGIFPGFIAMFVALSVMLLVIFSATKDINQRNL